MFVENQDQVQDQDFSHATETAVVHALHTPFRTSVIGMHIILSLKDAPKQ